MKVTVCCPSCRMPLVDGVCTCGFRPERSDGILDLMTPEQEAQYSTFVETFERIRQAEGFGSGDLDLPFNARSNRTVWKIRRRTFGALKRWLLEEKPKRGTALDAGAGNCWLSDHLSRWGFDVVALDVNSGLQDGLAVGTYYLNQGSRFDRIRAPMENLPFPSASFSLLVAGASFHYVDDMRKTLTEFKRVLHSDGVAILFDSPWYEHDADGDRAQQQRAQAYMKLYGLDENLARTSGYLVRSEFEELVRSVFGTRRYRSGRGGLDRWKLFVRVSWATVSLGFLC